MNFVHILTPFISTIFFSGKITEKFVDICPYFSSFHFDDFFFHENENKIVIMKVIYAIHIFIIAVDRNSLIKHVGVIHKVVDQFVKAPMEDDVKDEPANDSVPLTNATTIECRLCDKPQYFR